MSDDAQLAEFEHYERGGSHVLEVPNPRIDETYFHGDNPLADAQELGVAEGGESTAEAQQRQGGLGWNEEAGAPPEAAEQEQGGFDTGGEGAGQAGGGNPSAGDQGGAADQTAGDETGGSVGDSETPDHTWKNAEIEAWLDAQGIEYQRGANKAELLDAAAAAEGDGTDE